MCQTQEGCLGSKTGDLGNQPNALILGDLHRVLPPEQQDRGGARDDGGGVWNLRTPGVVRAVVKKPVEVIHSTLRGCIYPESARSNFVCIGSFLSP